MSDEKLQQYLRDEAERIDDIPVARRRLSSALIILAILAAAITALALLYHFNKHLADIFGAVERSTLQAVDPSAERSSENAVMIATVRRYYELIAERKFLKAYAMWSPDMRGSATVDDLASEFAATTDLRADVSPHVNGNLVSAMVTQSDRYGTFVRQRTFRGTWRLKLIAGQWMLDYRNFKTVADTGPPPEAGDESLVSGTSGSLLTLGSAGGDPVTLYDSPNDACSLVAEVTALHDAYASGEISEAAAIQALQNFPGYVNVTAGSAVTVTSPASRVACSAGGYLDLAGVRVINGSEEGTKGFVVPANIEGVTQP